MATIIVGVVMMVLGVVLWFNSRISIGGLIAGVGKLGESELRGFKSAWIAGWERRWPMFGLGLLTLLPIWIITVPTYLINKNLQQQQMEIIANPSLYDLGPDYFYPYLGLCGVICAMLVIILPLYLFQVLADRACMLEALTFSEAVGRAWQVVRQKAGQMIVLFLIQIGIALGIGLVAGVFVCMLSCGLGALASMMSPMLSMAVSYVLMPFMFVFSGIIQTYFSAVWTIAWLDWANDVLAHNIKVETPVTSG
ncbi:MAG: hypothetical protein JXB07_14005 [Anaerolineae bacterium]|nr:hypothetical protein [Anaerolineae bacterium]